MIKAIRIYITLALVIIATCLSPTANTQTPSSGIGIVIMHGKGGSPAKHVADLASSLEEKGLVKAQRLHRAHLAGPGKEFAFYQITLEGLNVVHSYALLKAKLGRVD